MNPVNFEGTFGKRAEGTGAPLAELGLAGIPFLEEFAKKVGTGIFRAGMLSVCSVRETGVDLKPWKHLLPDGAKHFATNGLGEMFFVAGDGLHFLLTHDATEAVEIETTPEKFFDWLETEGMHSYVRQVEWNSESRKLKPNEILTFEPPLAAGGKELIKNLRVADFKQTLATLAKLRFA